MEEETKRRQEYLCMPQRWHRSWQRVYLSLRLIAIERTSNEHLNCSRRNLNGWRTGCGGSYLPHHSPTTRIVQDRNLRGVEDRDKDAGVTDRDLQKDRQK
jgi:hypothetical protein